jgi:hypothetical protein
LVQHQIKEKKIYLFLFRFIHFGLIEHFSLSNFINSIQFHEIDCSLFEPLRCAFGSNYFLLFENSMKFQNDRQHLTLIENIDDFFREDELNRNFKSLFEFYPILLSNVLEIQTNEQTELFFTEDQIKQI